jgi:hypothetical protein
VSAISRKPLNLREFVKSGEVPPDGYEEYQVWLFERSIITEKEALRAIADHRRDKASGWGAQMVPPVPKPRSKKDSLAEWRQKQESAE